MEYIDRVIKEIELRDSNEKEFIQAVKEVLNSVSCIFEQHPEYEDLGILERLVEPDRIITFRVPWVNDQNKVVVNRGYRIQFNNSLGPYKGGLRFHPSVNLSILKFLGFEQIFKNALTTLPIGGAKGGSDFDPKGKSDGEIRRFCQSFMLELYRHIGPDIDVPAGDMGVGQREIGYLYGYYKRIRNCNEPGVLTGKNVLIGGSNTRKEATGYGLIYFFKEIADRMHIEIKGQKAIVSGSGNVAIYAACKAQELGVNIIGMSDSHGYIVDDNVDLNVVKQIKEVNRGSLKDYPSLSGHGTYHEGSIYDAKLSVDFVFPCATQNEINLERAKNIVNNGCRVVCEGANMPNDNDAIQYYLDNGIIFAPGKASNAGGVATSALEMAQNSMRLSWTYEEVDEKLKGIMKSIHKQCIDMMDLYHLDPKNYVQAANIAGVQKVIDAMLLLSDY